MAACSPLDGEVTPTDKSGASSATQASNIQYNNSSVVASVSSATPVNDRIEGEEAYEEVANLNDEEFRNFLEEVTNATKVPNKKKNYISPRAKFLLQKEEDALREESGSGEDCSDLALTHRKKRVIGRREQQRDHSSSAASRTSTGGSLGSLHDLTDIKPPKKSGGTHQGVASRSIEGGSCGNLSRGSFETQPPQKRKGKRNKNASASQREGGSLQNLSKTESGGGDSKVLQKSGSLSQVFTDAGGGARTKIRRQKTASESSSARYSRCAEDREGDSSGDEGLEQEFPYQPLNQSPHSTLSTHSADHQFFPALPSEWSNDSTVAEHQTDEASDSDSSDDGTDAMHRSANDVLACYTQDKERNVERGLELQQITCTTAQCDNLTEHGGCFDNYTLHRNQDSSSSSNSSMSQKIPLRLQESCVPVLKGGNIIIRADEETSEKRRCNISGFETNAENKPSLDENGNPVLSGGSSSNSKSSCSSNPSGSISTVHTRRSGFTTQKESTSNYERLRTRKNKKAKKGEKQYSENFPGFRGYQDLESILKFLGAEESSSTNNKKNKKNKSKKDDVKEEKECSKKKSKTVKSDIEDNDKYCSINSNNENRETCLQGDKGDKNIDGSEKKVDDKLNKNRCAESKKSKNSCGTLRESNSMEDLVSKNKQNTAVKDIRKQVTMDDEVISLVSLSGTYQGQSRCLSDQKKSGKIDSVVGCSVEKLGPVLCDVPTTSEFVADFYKAGDSFVDHDVEPNKGPVCGGDFELVKRKRNRRGNNTTPHCHFANRGPGNGGGVGASCNEVRFHPNGVKINRGNPSEKPLINFTEFPRTAHESFLAQWSYTGVGERYGTTTSAPHSEDSDSDGGDSVHSMPAPSITPRPSVRKPSPSTDSTPQASYANIARQAANANRAQMRRMAPVVDPVVDQEVKVISCDGDKQYGTQEVKVNENCSEPSANNILDGNFPSLAESVGGLLPSGVNPTIPLSDSKSSTTVEGPVLALKENEFPQLNNKETVTVSKVSSDMANCKLYPKNSYKVQNDKNREVKLSRVTNEKLDNVLSNNSQNINEKNVIINNCNNHSDLLMNKRIINISPKNVDNSRAWLKESKCVFVCNTVSSSSLTSETSPSKKPEPVIFADHAKFSISASGVEFGFDDTLVTSSDNGNVEKKLPAVVDNQEEKCDTSVKISNNVVKDFSKWYQAPKNDQISYNYEELLKHFSKEWKVTLRQMEEDPTNIQYWQAAPSTPAPLCAAEADSES